MGHISRTGSIAGEINCIQDTFVVEMYYKECFPVYESRKLKVKGSILKNDKTFGPSEKRGIVSRLCILARYRFKGRGYGYQTIGKGDVSLAVQNVLEGRKTQSKPKNRETLNSRKWNYLFENVNNYSNISRTILLALLVTQHIHVLPQQCYW